MGRRFISELWFFLFCSLLWKGCAAGAVLTVDPDWSTLFIGEFVNLTCGVEGGDSDWEYSFNKDNQQYRDYQPSKFYTFQITSTGDGGEYDCVGRHNSSLQTEKSDTVSLTAAEKPKANLRSGKKTISVGGKVSLYCSVGNSDGWKFEFFRKTSTTEERRVEKNVQNNKVKVSKGGIYQCRGERETSGYLSDISHQVTINITFDIKPVITQQPSSSEMLDDEKVNLTCEVQGGGATDWRYYWIYDWWFDMMYYRRSYCIDSQSIPDWHEKLLQVNASKLFTGVYSCWAQSRDDDYSSTLGSDPFPQSQSRPVLSVSPSWLIPGASVTLTCHTEHPSAGWSFYWFKGVPDIQNGYIDEPLPGTSSGTTNNSFTVHGQTHTAAYRCSVVRGAPRLYSVPTVVWSSDVHPSASLTVNPARVQHFTSESLSLTCEGNSTQWMVMTYKNENSTYIYYRTYDTINGSLNITNEQPMKAVYFCQSGTALSNAVNISTHSDGVILVSPVYPVPEGDSVTLGCELKAGTVSSDVFFYKDGKIIQNDTGGEMKISAVSESDQGFYKCRYKGKESAQSWMAVKLVSRPGSSLAPLTIIRWVCGFSVLTVLSLLLCFYKGPKRNSAPAAAAETVYSEVTQIIEETSSPPATE